jgi:hypothetical protein
MSTENPVPDEANLSLEDQIFILLRKQERLLLLINNTRKILILYTIIKFFTDFPPNGPPTPYAGSAAIFLDLVRRALEEPKNPSSSGE